MRLAAAVVFLALNFYTYHFFATEEHTPTRASFSRFPLQLGDWRCTERQRLQADVERNLGATDYLICDYQRAEPPGLVGFYVGYHETQVRRAGGGSASANPIHPPRHCLPGSGWDIIGASKVVLELPGLPERPARANRLIVAKGEARQLVYYWYQSRGRVITEDWSKIVNLFWDRATRNRTDGSLVRFSVPILRDDDARAEADFQDLATRLLPLLPDFVPE
jgi:EpsI family protein